MKVLVHHIYEFKKGIRNLILHTMKANHRERAESVLNKHNIKYMIQIVSENKINIFFGDPVCIKIIENFGEKRLVEFNHEQDFMLGIMLGYDRLKQCERYIERREIV